MEIIDSSVEWNSSNDPKLIVIMNPVQDCFLWLSLKNIYL
ncbi:unnamed protein product [Acanthoscelides obtectus]|uniref:Uncharacterized protein n=1 Tax=Acanthoscelides obtectus TaxID=200917 RepID=A0A9P0PSZ1_ACAOB|nr:unnamed protein product [Acanthoscelides obtectus]CAK1681790.1 hypothetical protein AOBTE_LOCUS33274 [Acanthoscelides obtectus]